MSSGWNWELGVCRQELWGAGRGLGDRFLGAGRDFGGRQELRGAGREFGG